MKIIRLHRKNKDNEHIKKLTRQSYSFAFFGLPRRLPKSSNLPKSGMT
jgi:hypothetical protein